MPKVILLNVGTEHALHEEATAAHPLSRSALRHAWFLQPGDVIISPTPLPRDFIQYVGDTLGFDPATVRVLSWNRLVDDDLLSLTQFQEELRSIVLRYPNWTLMPCFFTPGAANLMPKLQLQRATGSEFAAERGHDLFNRKTHFRKLAAGLGLPLPEGHIASSPQMLALAIESHIKVTGTVIVKQDNAAGGMGNIALSQRKSPPLAGTCETWLLEGPAEHAAGLLWERLAVANSESLVVECYHAALHRFYFEYWVDRDGRPRFVDSGTIRLRLDEDPAARELVWVGLDIPAELPPYSLAEALTHTARFAVQAGQMGYRGAINIDAIITDHGELFFNEANGRWGGGFVLHKVAQRLLGLRYANHCALSSVREVWAPSRPQAVRKLRECGLHFDGTKAEGVIVLACDEYGDGLMECLLMGPHRHAVQNIENRVRELFASLVTLSGELRA